MPAFPAAAPAAAFFAPAFAAAAALEPLGLGLLPTERAGLRAPADGRWPTETDLRMAPEVAFAPALAMHEV